mgnify:CR=1 FL=1
MKEAIAKVGGALGVEGASKAVEVGVNHFTAGDNSMTEPGPKSEATPGLSNRTTTSDDRSDDGRNGESTGGI